MSVWVTATVAAKNAVAAPTTAMIPRVTGAAEKSGFSRAIM